MTLLWTTSNLPLSKLITWGLGEPVSHFALQINDQCIVHSDLLGFRIMWPSQFKSSHTIVYQTDLPMTLDQDQKTIDLINVNIGSGYDYGAFAYFCWSVLLKKLFNKPIPKKNPWGEKKGFLCEEVAWLIEYPQLVDALNKYESDILSPYQLYLVVQKMQTEIAAQPVQKAIAA